MSDKEALKIFSRQPVTNEMINFLAATTQSIIQVKSASKPKNLSSTGNFIVTPVSKHASVTLVTFIKNLIRYSNVQTPTLMATLIYLNKLRNLLPANAIGMETTRHRIFLASLILSAKSLNDSSPLNKHWTKYTDGLLNIHEVNMAERELINLLKWDINIKEDELIIALQPFLSTIKHTLARKQENDTLQKINYYRLSNSYNNLSLAAQSTATTPVTPTHSLSSSSSAHSSISSMYSSNSLLSLNRSSSSNYNLNHHAIEDDIDDKKFHHHHSNSTTRLPLSAKSMNHLNRPRQQPLHRHTQSHQINKNYRASSTTAPTVSESKSYSEKLTSFYNSTQSDGDSCYSRDTRRIVT